MDESYKTFHEEWQTSVLEDGITTSILQLKEWPESLDGTAKLRCAVFKGEELQAKSDEITLESHGRCKPLYVCSIQLRVHTITPSPKGHKENVTFCC